MSKPTTSTRLAQPVESHLQKCLLGCGERKKKKSALTSAANKIATSVFSGSRCAAKWQWSKCTAAFNVEQPQEERFSLSDDEAAWKVALQRRTILSVTLIHNAGCDGEIGGGGVARHKGRGRGVSDVVLPLLWVWNGTVCLSMSSAQRSFSSSSFFPFFFFTASVSFLFILSPSQSPQPAGETKIRLHY